MDKNNFVDIAKQKLKGKALDIILRQIDNFFELKDKNIKKQTYSVGDTVFLNKNMFLHGFRDLAVVDIGSKYGVISRNFTTNDPVREPKIKNCASLFHIKKKISLKQYIINHSGLQVDFCDGLTKSELIPFGEVDKFMSQIRKKTFPAFGMVLPMETSFIPNLMNKRPQIAFIINGTDSKCKNLLENNLLNKKFDINLVLNFHEFYNEKLKEKFLQDDKDSYYDRIAYILFGIPNNMIEGILVGEIVEKNKSVLSKLKKAFPNCYICNIFGKVIK